jgi:hypothetical protein
MSDSLSRAAREAVSFNFQGFALQRSSAERTMPQELLEVPDLLVRQVDRIVNLTMQTP